MSEIRIEDLSPEQREALAQEVDFRLERIKCEDSLADFVRASWTIVEPRETLIWNWHLDTLCAYLEEVFRPYKEPGYEAKFRRLIINIPPGTMKSLVVNVFLPAWIWTWDPTFRLLCGSNGEDLAVRDARRMRSILLSDWYQGYWGTKVVDGEVVDWVKIAKDQDEKTLFANTKHGHRQSQGMRGRVTGKRGDAMIIDDPHDAKGTESDIQRREILDAWDNAWSSRVNNINTSPIILIMQRLHVDDLTGHLLEKSKQNWCHLCIPMYYDPELTFDAGKDLGRPELNDPRTEEGELLFPQRFSKAALEEQEESLGPYGVAGQFQQRPSPKGGGELRKEWLCFYNSTDDRRGNKFILVDPAGERKQGQQGGRDNSAMGVLMIGDDGNIYLLDAYRDRLNLVERTEILFDWHRKYRPIFVGYESYGMQNDIAHIQSEMELTDYRFKITELRGTLSKNDRIRRLVAPFAAGRIWLPRHLWKTSRVSAKPVDLIKSFVEEEYETFPAGKHDDFLDMLARLEDEEVKKSALKRPKPRPNLSLVSTTRLNDPGAGY